MNILNSKNLDKGNVPKDILTLRKIFDSLGIEEYEKNTLNFMSEFLNTYITDLLNDSKKNMLLANRNKINIEDVKLAVNLKQNILYKNKLNVEDLKILANSVNKIELPGIPDTPNILMPPTDNSLLKNNFQIYSDNLFQYYLNNEHSNEENSNLKPEIPFLGFKRKDEKINENKNNENNTQKKRRKLSLTQAFKTTKEKEENAKKLEKNKIKIENDLNEKNDNNNNNNNNNINDNEEGGDAIFEDEIMDNLSNDNQNIESKNLTSHKQSSDKFESIHNDDEDEGLNEDDF